MTNSLSAISSIHAAMAETRVSPLLNCTTFASNLPHSSHRSQSQYSSPPLSLFLGRCPYPFGLSILDCDRDNRMYVGTSNLTYFRADISRSTNSILRKRPFRNRCFLFRRATRRYPLTRLFPPVTNGTARFILEKQDIGRVKSLSTNFGTDARGFLHEPD